MGYQNGVFLQRSRVCNGFCVTPVLSNIFLAKIDYAIAIAVEFTPVTKVFRCVDALRCPRKDCCNSRTFLLPCTQIICAGLSHPTLKRGILLYTFSHFKVEKRGIAISCLSSALKKSCHHAIPAHFLAQMERLTTSRFPIQVITKITRTLVKKK